MKDPYFERTVVCICTYDEDGALGFIINKPLPITQGELLLQATEIDIIADAVDSIVLSQAEEAGAAEKETSEEPAQNSIRQQLAEAPQYQRNALFGGPVQLDSGFLLLQDTLLPEAESCWKLHTEESSSGKKHSEAAQQEDEDQEPSFLPQFEIRAASQNISMLLIQRYPFDLILGYSGWGKGQLEKEIESGSWLYCDSTDIDLGELLLLPAEERYTRALAALGLSAGLIMMKPTEA
jgi:putative transcriptional regulator